MCLFDCQRASLGTKEAVKVQPHQCVESYLHATCRDLHAEFEFGSWPGTKAETQLLASLISTLSEERARLARSRTMPHANYAYGKMWPNVVCEP